MTIERTIFLTLATLFLLSCRVSGGEREAGGDWLQWRGSMHTRVSPGEDFHASRVIVGNDLIIRGFSSLYCFSE